MYKRRVAYIDHARTAYIYGGVCSYIYSLLECCESIGAYLDVCTDMDIRSRSKWVPPEVQEALSGHTFTVSPVEYSSSQHSPYPAMESALAVEALFQQLKYKVYDLIIFGTISCLEAALVSGLQHPNIFLYLHQHEIFTDLLPMSISPRWYTDRSRTCLKYLPIRGIITQCDTNIPRIVRMTGVDNVVSIPITMPGFAENFTGSRDGIAFLGSGERLKNPELAIEIFEHINQPIYFYVGRGSRRLRKLLQGVGFDYEIHEKLSYSELRNELQKRLCGIHCAWVEGFGLSVAEQMHYYPMLIWDGGDYAEHFPSALAFSTAAEATEIIRKLYNDKSYWDQSCQDNEEYLKGLRIENIAPKYEVLMDTGGNVTSTLDKVARFVGQDIRTYSEVLRYLNWKDVIVAAGYSIKWPVEKTHDVRNTYFVGSRDVSFEPIKTEGMLF